jgi:hypothetical protein
VRLTTIQSRLLSGFASYELAAAGALEAKGSPKPATFGSATAHKVAHTAQANGTGSLFSGCPFRIGDNVNVSQNCHRP